MKEYESCPWHKSKWLIWAMKQSRRNEEIEEKCYAPGRVKMKVFPADKAQLHQDHFYGWDNPYGTYIHMWILYL